MADQRPPTIGASDVPVILGLSPWADASAWATWARIMGLVPRYSSEGTPAQARGRMLEPAILTRYATERDVLVMPGPGLGQPGMAGPEPWMHARPDGWAWTDPKQTPSWIVEAKTSRYLDEADGWGPDGSDEVPAYYLAQVAWQLACTQLPRCDVAAFGLVRDDWRVYPIARDPDIERRLVARVGRWYRRHVVEAVPPDVDGKESTRRALSMAYRGVTGERVEADASDLDLVRRLRAVREAAEAIAEQQRELENRLRLRLGSAVELVDGERPLARLADRKGRETVDAKRLRQEHPEIYAQLVRVGQPSRTLTLIEES